MFAARIACWKERVFVARLLIPICGHDRNEETFVILFLTTLKVIGGILCLTKLAVNRTVDV